MRVIVGLGNPGNKYRYTRHNVGFLVLDSYLELIPGAFWGPGFQGYFFKHQDYILLKPSTYMNLSGDSVSELIKKYKLDVSDVLVVYDDLYLAEGVFKFSKNKNSGGHNGVRNIIERLGTKDFLTLRVGIGPRERAESIADYVMEEFSSESLRTLTSLYPLLFSAIQDFISGFKAQELQTKYNQKTST